MRLFLIMLFTSLSLAAPANAQDVYPIAPPEQYDLPTQSNEPVPDIYTRQLQYRIEANKFRKQILERQKSFQSPLAKARKRYEEQLKQLNEERGSEFEKKAAEEEAALEKAAALEEEFALEEELALEEMSAEEESE